MKKLISALLVLALSVALLIPLGVVTVSADEPTLITDQAGLAAMSANGNYKLANDITISGDWSNDTFFKGTFDGDGHTITYAEGSTIHGGLFKQLQEGATVKNLNIAEGGTVQWTTAAGLPANNGTACFGGLTGSIQASAGNFENDSFVQNAANKVTVQNVHVNVNLYTNAGTTGSHQVAIGGIVGDLGLITRIENCSFSGSITDSTNRDGVDMNAYMSGSGAMIGVAVRNCGPIAIIGCVNNGSITGYGQVGGIIGYSRGWGGGETAPAALIIQKCINNGTITCQQTDLGTEGNPKRASVGGIAGYIYVKNGAIADFLHNINNGNVVAAAEENVKIEAGICGVIRQKETVTFEGNINLGNSKSQMIHTGLSNGVVNYANNYAANGGESEKYKTFEEAGGIAAVFSALEEAYPGVYLFNDNMITLAEGSSESGSSSLNVPQTMTMDVTVPEATGTAITNQKELEAMTADGTYYLANDVEIKGTLKSVAEFSGVFHGNGHTIVLNGAELRGGFFKSLAGGKVYNLSITEASKSDNGYRGIISANEIDICLGAVAGYGYGTIVNVTVNCAIGSSLKNSSNAYVGGVIGIVTDGDSVLYNCYNTGKVQGGNAGGIVGEVFCENGKVEISRCVNWGEVTSSSGAAGGILAMHRLTAIKVDMNLLALENVNYGAVSTTGSRYCGGIAGSVQSFWEGKAAILRNINYGTVKANAEDLGCPGGIIGYVGYNGILIAGNVNAGSVEGTKSPNRLVATVESNEGVVAENNFAAEAEIPATVGEAAGVTVDANTVATLNGAYADTFAAGSPIALKWAADAGLSEAAPTISYTVAEDPEQQGNSGEQGNNNQNNNQNNNPTTSEVATQAPAAQTETKKKGGCGSAIGLGGVIALLMLCGAGSVVMTKRKED